MVKMVDHISNCVIRFIHPNERYTFSFFFLQTNRPRPNAYFMRDARRKGVKYSSGDAICYGGENQFRNHFFAVQSKLGSCETFPFKKWMFLNCIESWFLPFPWLGMIFRIRYYVLLTFLWFTSLKISIRWKMFAVLIYFNGVKVLIF